MFMQTRLLRACPLPKWSSSEKPFKSFNCSLWLENGKSGKNGIWTKTQSAVRIRSRVHLEDACKMWLRYCSHMFGSIKILKQPMHSPADEDRTMAYSYSLPAHMHINFQFDQVHTEKIAFLERQRKPTARHTDVTRENGCWNSWINGTNSQWILIKIAKKKKIGMRNGISATQRQHFAFAEWKNRSEFYDAFAHRPPPATEKMNSAWKCMR